MEWNKNLVSLVQLCSTNHIDPTIFASTTVETLWLAEDDCERWQGSYGNQAPYPPFASFWIHEGRHLGFWRRHMVAWLHARNCASCNKCVIIETTEVARPGLNILINERDVLKRKWWTLFELSTGSRWKLQTAKSKAGVKFIILVRERLFHLPSLLSACYKSQ